MRRPARRRRRQPGRADRGGRQPPRAGPPDGRRPGRAGRDGHPRQSRHRRCAPDEPALRERRPERPADRRLRPPQPLPHDLPARDERALDRRRRLRQVRRDRPDHRRPGNGRERRLALCRGPTAATGLGAPRHDPLPTAPRHPPAVLLLRARGQGRPRRDVPVGEHVALRARVLPGRALPGRLRRRALLRRLLAGLHLGHARRRERPAEPEPTSITFVAPATNPVALEIGPGGDLFYADFGGDPVVGGGKTPGTIRRIGYFAGNQPPVARIEASATSGLAPLTVQFDGRDSSDPEAAHAHLCVGPRRRRRAGRLDLGDAAAHLHRRRQRHREVAGHGPAAVSRTTSRCSSRSATRLRSRRSPRRQPP